MGNSFIALLHYPSPNFFMPSSTRGLLFYYMTNNIVTWVSELRPYYFETDTLSIQFCIIKFFQGSLHVILASKLHNSKERHITVKNWKYDNNEFTKIMISCIQLNIQLGGKSSLIFCSSYKTNGPCILMSFYSNQKKNIFLSWSVNTLKIFCQCWVWMNWKSMKMYYK